MYGETDRFSGNEVWLWDCYRSLNIAFFPKSPTQWLLAKQIVDLSPVRDVSSSQRRGAQSLTCVCGGGGVG